jgi:hypothetical protein
VPRDVSLDDLARLRPRWRLPIDTLAPGMVRIAVDGESTLAVVAAGWEPVPRVLVVDLVRGRLADVVEPVATISVFGAAQSVLCHDTGWRSGGSDEARLLEFSAHGTVVRPLRRTCIVTSFAPSGREVVLFAEGSLTVHAWPSLEETHRFHGHQAVVDWETRTVVLRASATNATQAWSFSAPVAVERFVAAAPDEWVDALGRGLLVPRWSGLTLISIDRGWRREIMPARRKEGDAFSLDASATHVRFLLGGKPRVVRFDRATGRILEVPPLTERLARKSDTLFHPSLDVGVYSKSRARPSIDLRLCAPGQPIVARLGTGLQPIAWTPDGLTLLAVRGEGEGRELEAWSVD